MATEILEAIREIFTHQNKEDFEFREGASDEEIIIFESELGLKLPDDFKAFYKFSDGIFALQQYHWMFQMLPLKEIIQYKHEYKPNEFTIAEYMIYADVWTVQINPTDPNDYSIINTNHNGEPVVLTNSLIEFLECFVRDGIYEDGGVYNWYDLKLKEKTNENI